MKQFNAKIIINKKIQEDHYILTFKAPKIAQKTKPGQFFNIRVNKSSKPLLRRPFGTHDITRDTITILYKVVGEATKLLSKKTRKDILDILGPLGNGFSIERQDQNPKSEIILIAGGHGVAPLYALAKSLICNLQHKRINVFIGARTKKYIVCDKDFRKLGVKVFISTEDGSRGNKSLITDVLENKIRSSGKMREFTKIYACGPNPMLKVVSKIAKRYNIPCEASLEEYMACGIGTCMGCPVKTKTGYQLVCKDGPIFDVSEIIWQ